MTATLAEVCTITMGQAPIGESYNDRGEGLPLIAGAGDFNGLRISPKKFTTAPGKVSETGDIILSIRASIGAKVWSDGEYCLGRGVAGLRPKAPLDSGYLWHWLTHVERALAAKGRGATFLQVNRGDIGEMPIELPPLPEQRRIAAILDHVDALRAKRRQILAHLDALTQSVFRAMFGKGEYSSRRLDELIDAGDRMNYGVVQPGDDTPGGVALIRVSDLAGGIVDRTRLKQISPEIEASYARSRLRGNEILVSSVGSIGAVSLVRPPDVGSNIARAITRVPISDEVLRTYVAAYLRTPTPQRYFVAELRTVAQPTLNVGQLAATEIPVPPVDLQLEFGHRLRAVQDSAQAVVRASAADNELFTSLQSRAFRGEL